MAYWKTFAELRNQSTRRHVMFHELVEAARQRGCRWCRARVLKELEHVARPTVKRYGHWHYGKVHMRAVIAAAERETAARAER